MTCETPRGGDFLRAPLEDTIWGRTYGSVAAVQAAFDRFAREYHRAIMASGAPRGAAGALTPHLQPGAVGMDLGCGSGALGLALKGEGFAGPLDGMDLSPVMLELAAATDCYRHLKRANLMQPHSPTGLASYDFVITMGLIGDYVPYYLGLPAAVSLLKPGGVLGFAVESRSTPWRPLEQFVEELGLRVQSESVLEVNEVELVRQTYHFYVARLEEAMPVGETKSPGRVSSARALE